MEWRWIISPELIYFVAEKRQRSSSPSVSSLHRSYSSQKFEHLFSNDKQVKEEGNEMSALFFLMLLA